MGLQIQLLNADTSREIDADATLACANAPTPLHCQHRVFHKSACPFSPIGDAAPAAYVGRQYVEIGGLMGYGANVVDVRRQLGDDAGDSPRREPADLPVQQASKFELVINHQTARMLGLDVLAEGLAGADEVIE